ncbi:hypothetical protein CerSpe_252150 [Prunus speciosa]
MKSLTLKISRFFSLICFNRTHSSSSQSQLNKPLIEKTFFKSNTKDGLISRLCKDGKFKEAIDILCEQKRLAEAVQLLNRIDRPSASIYLTLLQLCLQQRALVHGKLVHAHTKVSGFVPGLFICNRLIDLYAKCGSLVDAQKVFDEMAERDLCSWNTMISGYAKVGQLGEARKLFGEMPEKDNFSWTAMISGYVRHERPKEALQLYRTMQRHENSKSNKFTVSSALAASAANQSLRLGKEIHGYIIDAAQANRFSSENPEEQ